MLFVYTVYTPQSYASATISMVGLHMLFFDNSRWRVRYFAIR